MKSFFKFFLLLSFLFLSNNDLLAQVNWTKYEGNPIITGGAAGSWNMQIFLPFVLYNADSSRYEMWFSASDKSSGDYLLRPWKIGFATSPDGITWNIYPTPVLSPSLGQWDSQTVEEAFVIRENGQYKMWYAGGARPTPQAIGYATSPDGINWTKHPSNPILTKGIDAWEAGGVCGPFLMPYESGYKVWYTAWNVLGTQEYIGYATSVDGIVWQRDTQNNPVLSPGNLGSWDDTWLGIPRVIYKDNIYYMYFSGVDAIWGKMQIGLATSSNEVDWQKHQSNPVLQPSAGQWDEANVNPGNVLLIGDTLYFWYDGGGFNPAVNTYKIGLATSPLEPVSVENEPTQPTEFVLEQNYPNPFNPSTKIKYSVPQSSKVVIKVYDILGNEIKSLLNEEKTAGNYELEFNASNLPSGIYFYRIQAGSFIETKKMILMK